MAGNRNLVAKFMETFNRPAVVQDKKKDHRNGKAKHKKRIDRDFE